MKLLQRAQFLVDSLGYKPGVKFGVQPLGVADFPDERWNIPDPSCVGIYITVPIDDVYQPGRLLLYGQVHMVPAYLLAEGAEDDFCKWLFEEVVVGAERHEAAEHFTVFGKRIYDPHG